MKFESKEPISRLPGDNDITKLLIASTNYVIDFRNQLLDSCILIRTGEVEDKFDIIEIQTLDNLIDEVVAYLED